MAGYQEKQNTERKKNLLIYWKVLRRAPLEFIISVCFIYLNRLILIL
jgi:hypothetical protein